MASCYANPALAERELGWKAAFGLDKMCKSTPPFPGVLCAAGCPSCGPPLTAALSLLQVRTCGGGSCRIPQASARTEPWPEGSPGCRGLLWASPACLPPAAPARLPPSWVQFQLPLLPLARGGKARASPASSLLSLVPPGPLHLIEQRHKEERSQGLALAPKARNPLVGMYRGWCQPQQGEGWALRPLLEPLLRPPCALEVAASSTQTGESY